ncbi:ATP-binding protein, partial [Gemmatimonadota bacterium]
QVLLNLVWNSVEALASRPGSVCISVRGEESGITLEVTDDGPGFPVDLLDAPVQAFRTSRSQGTGLGLAMVRRTATDLGGTMTLGNRSPTGAWVRLFLPCEPLGEA